MLAILLPVAALAAEPCIPQDVPVLVQHARTLLMDDEPQAAREVHARIEASLHCADRHLSPHELSAAYQVCAAIAIRQDDPDRAVECYASAIRLAPQIPFDPTLEPRGRNLYSQASGAVRASPPIMVGAPGGVLLDGLLIVPGGRRAVAPGEHIVQYIEDGQLVTELLDLQADTQVGPAAERPSTRSRIAGIGLLALGTGLLTTGSYWQFYAGQHDQYGSTLAGRYRWTANALSIGGVVALGLGGVVLSFSPLSTSTPPAIGLSGRW